MLLFHFDGLQGDSQLIYGHACMILTIRRLIAEDAGTQSVTISNRHYYVPLNSANNVQASGKKVGTVRPGPVRKTGTDVMHTDA